jgi:hypothetical protein
LRTCGRALVRADSGGTREFLKWLTARSRPLRYSIGMTITDDTQAATGKVPASAWTPRPRTTTAGSGTTPGSRTSARHDPALRIITSQRLKQAHQERERSRLVRKFNPHKERTCRSVARNTAPAQIVAQDRSIPIRRGT